MPHSSYLFDLVSRIPKLKDKCPWRMPKQQVLVCPRWQCLRASQESCAIQCRHTTHKDPSLLFWPQLVALPRSPQLAGYHPFPGARLRLKLFSPAVFTDLHREKIKIHKYHILSNFNLLTNRCAIPWPKMIECEQSLKPVWFHFQHQSGLVRVYTANLTQALREHTIWWLESMRCSPSSLRTDESGNLPEFQNIPGLLHFTTEIQRFTSYQLEQRPKVLIKQRIILQNNNISRLL